MTMGNLLARGNYAAAPCSAFGRKQTVRFRALGHKSRHVRCRLLSRPVWAVPDPRRMSALGPHLIAKTLAASSTLRRALSSSTASTPRKFAFRMVVPRNVQRSA